MSTEITVTPDQMETIRKTIAKGASDQNLALFLFDCKRQGVHPMDKLIHFTERGGKYTPITSIDYMRSRASDTGEHAGTDAPVFVGTPGTSDFSATVTVYRLVGANRCAFTASANWSEYYGDGGSPVAKKMPRIMLGKCAEALALRKGFPRQLSGIYEGAELPQNVEIIDTTTGEILDKPKAKPKLTQSMVDLLCITMQGYPDIVNAELGSEGLESIEDIKDDQQLARIVQAVTLKIGSVVPPAPPPAPPPAEKAKVACITQDQNLTIYKAYMAGCKKDRENRFEPVEMESRKKEFRLWAKGMCGVTDSREIPAEHYDAALQAARRISSERDGQNGRV